MSSRILHSFAASVALLAALAASASAAMKTLVQIAPLTVPAHASEKTITLDIHKVRAQLLAAAVDRKRDVVLDLDDIEADVSPGVVYEVWLSVPKQPPQNAGNIVLFGSGIRSEARGSFQPAKAHLYLSEALAKLLDRHSERTLTIRFLARGAGGAGEPRSAAALKIGKASINVIPRERE